jgi:hypothetical protein
MIAIVRDSCVKSVTFDAGNIFLIANKVAPPF